MRKDLQRPPDAAPEGARRLGRSALKLRINLLGLARIHDAALAGLETTGQPACSDTTAIRRSDAFFDAAVSSFIESHLVTTASEARIKNNIDTLTRRTRDLAALNKELRKEIAQRKAVEKSLRTSETTTSLLLKKSLVMQEEMRFLSRRLLTVQEDERKRISRELHDVIAQSLAGINVRLAVLRFQNYANAKEFHDNIEVTERLVEQSVEIMHRFAYDLRPSVLDDIGLIPALRAYFGTFSKRTGIPVRLTALAAVETLDGHARIALFRIAQEALTNIARHSEAKLVKVDLRTAKGNLRMKISDNGRGFGARKKVPAHGSERLGLLGMRERAEMLGGSFRIDSVIEGGTTLQVEIPLASPAPIELPEESPKPRITPKSSP